MEILSQDSRKWSNDFTIKPAQHIEIMGKDKFIEEFKNNETMVHAVKYSHTHRYDTVEQVAEYTYNNILKTKKEIDLDNIRRVKPYKVIIIKKSFGFRPYNIKDLHTMYTCTEDFETYSYKFKVCQLVFNPRLYEIHSLKSTKKYAKNLFPKVIRKFPNQFKFTRLKNSVIIN